MNISGTQVFVMGTVVIASLVAYLVKRSSGPPFLVERWAKDNGFRILHSEFCYLSKGPFTWKGSHRGQEVYYVRVRDLEGQERCCWLRCMDVGIFTDEKTEVVWETGA